MMKNLSQFKISLLLFLFLTTLFSAQKYDEQRQKSVFKQLGLEKAKVHNELYVEKKMPNQEDAYIIVVPVLQSKFEYDAFNIKNTILITNKEGQIKIKYVDPTEFASDAIMLSSFTIDTGLYNLNSNTRAFGISTNYTGSSRPNPYYSSDISLFIQDGKTLKKILNGYPLETFSGEWDTNCSGAFEEEKSLILIDKIKTSGFANLKIKTETAKIINKPTNDDCKETKSSKISYKTLKFSKGKYQ